MKTIRILPKFFTASLTLAIALAIPSAHAATWVGGNSGVWSATTSWSPANVPDTTGEDATFTTGGAATVDGTFVIGDLNSTSGSQTQILSSGANRVLNITGTLTSTTTLARFRAGGTTTAFSLIAATANLTGSNVTFGESDVAGRLLSDLDIAALSISGGARVRVATGSTATTTLGVVTFGTGGGTLVTNNRSNQTITVSASSLNGTTGLISSSDATDAQDGANTTLVINKSAGTASYSGLIADRSDSAGLVAADSTTVLNLRKIGVGTQTLGGANTYAGITEVNDGTLFINGNQAGATGAVTVASAGTLGGSGGTIGGATTVSGTLAPGNNSRGILNFSATTVLPTVNNALTLTNTANTIMEIADLTPGTGHDQIVLTGAANVITYDGTLTLDIGTVIANGTYDLFSFAAESAPLARNFDTVAFASGGAYTGTFTDPTTMGIWMATSMGQTFTFTESNGDLTVAAVPEPTTVAMLLGGAGMLALLRRRRK